MSNVLHRTDKRYLKSVNTPDFSPEHWVINPDVSSLNGVPVKYWKITGDIVTEMTQEEKDAVDAAEIPPVKLPKVIFNLVNSKTNVNSQIFSDLSTTIWIGGNIFGSGKVAFKVEVGNVPLEVRLYDINSMAVLGSSTVSSDGFYTFLLNTPIAINATVELQARKTGAGTASKIISAVLVLE